MKQWYAPYVFLYSYAHWQSMKKIVYVYFQIRQIIFSKGVSWIKEDLSFVSETLKIIMDVI